MPAYFRLASPLCALFGLLATHGSAAGTDEASNLTDLSLEQLADVPAVRSSKVPAELFDAPTGSFVFGEDKLKNLPVDSLPEMLRYAPGVHIVRPSNGIWGLGMRGINSRFFNRVQFTVDEQNVYSTIFAGLFGSQHDLLMEDVASVEVAYGPGGGTWDNNAVNGMVNVLMKTAFETEGSLLRAQIGSESNQVAARVGWAIDDTTSARVYAKGGSRNPSLTRFDYSNRWDTARAGFRVDKRTTSRDLFSVSGEAFHSSLGYAYNLADFETGDLAFMADTETLKGANAQLKWTRNNSDGSAYSVRSWVAYSDLDAPYAAFGMVTAGAEGRGAFRIGDRHVVNLNLGGAYDHENTSSTLASDFTRPHLRNFALYGGFQDEWTFVPDQLKLSWGVDLRHEDKSSISTASPNARLIYQIGPDQRAWLSYSQAKRTTPVSLSVIESLRSGKVVPEIVVPTPVGPITIDRQLTDAVSNRELSPETLDALEAGYRRTFGDDKGSLSLNLFYYDYDKIFARIGLSATPVLFVEHPYLNVKGSYENLLEGDARGFELFADWQLTDSVYASFSYARMVDSFKSLIHTEDPFVHASIQFSIDEFDNSTPGHIAVVNLSADLAKNWNLNTGFRYTSGYDFAKGAQPEILQADARLSWQQSERIRLSLVGRNLLDAHTQEARLKDFFGHWTEMDRELYLEVSASF